VGKIELPIAIRRPRSHEPPFRTTDKALFDSGSDEPAVLPLDIARRAKLRLGRWDWTSYGGVRLVLGRRALARIEVNGCKANVDAFVPVGIVKGALDPGRPLRAQLVEPPRLLVLGHKFMQEAKGRLDFVRHTPDCSPFRRRRC
jgi:hypothetical protein